MSDEQQVGGLTAWAMVWTDRLIWTVLISALVYTGNALRKEWTGEARQEKQRECFLAYYAQENEIDRKEAKVEAIRKK